MSKHYIVSGVVGIAAGLVAGIIGLHAFSWESITVVVFSCVVFQVGRAVGEHG